MYENSVILFSVKVPVLSVHRMSMLPKFCIDASRFTMTPFLDIAIAPFERFTETMRGSSSGVIPTANATAKSSDCKTSLLRRAFTKKTKITRRKVTWVIR